MSFNPEQMTEKTVAVVNAAIDLARSYQNPQLVSE
jgi:hypothetical protein